MVKKTSVKKIAVFIIAYQAVKTFDEVIRRIPKEVYGKVNEIFLIDDSSDDNTYYAALGYKYRNALKKLNVYRNPKNLGYGGNQKKGYNYAIKKGQDIVVMLHGDAQYAPEALGKMLQPLIDDEADMVNGSRMMGHPLKGGMPVYKFLGNRFLTFIQNALLGSKLSEFHSGYRAYSCHALKKVPFNKCSDDFHFDTEILIQFHSRGLRIKEVPIPTFYGDEISRVKSITYGFNVLRSIFQYVLHKKGMAYYEKYDFKMPG
ncbi:glycosyltransferase family 2 protein [Candidatus Woesearchaeota archaeon]|nr:glycosyltransferase family 2 protein [Candidatus Woesearchaeota archaeon]